MKMPLLDEEGKCPRLMYDTPPASAVQDLELLANEPNGSAKGNKNSIYGLHSRSSFSVPAPARATSDALIVTDDAVTERNRPVGPCTRHT